MSFLTVFILIIVLNYGLSFLLAQFIASALAISMIIDLVIAFVSAIFFLPPPLRKKFYKTQFYYQMAGIITIVFLVSTIIFEVLF